MRLHCHPHLACLRVPGNDRIRHRSPKDGGVDLAFAHVSGAFRPAPRNRTPQSPVAPKRLLVRRLQHYPGLGGRRRARIGGANLAKITPPSARLAKDPDRARSPGEEASESGESSPEDSPRPWVRRVQADAVAGKVLLSNQRGVRYSEEDRHANQVRPRPTGPSHFRPSFVRFSSDESVRIPICC